MPLSLSRRAFALGVPTAALSVSAVPFAARAIAAPSSAMAVAPLAQIKVGRFTVTALSDGYADMPFGYFPGRSAEQARGIRQLEGANEGKRSARPTHAAVGFRQFKPSMAPKARVPVPPHAARPSY